MSQSTFIVDVAANSVIGYVQNAAVAAEKAGENLVVSSASDLEALSLQQLTDLFNAFEGGEPVKKFKVAKDQAAIKVFASMNTLDITAMTQLDSADAVKVETQAEKVEVAKATGPKVRKERDSKLQRMKHAFLEKDEAGNYKQWTIAELMAKGSKPGDPVTERIATVYVSILRSPTDRFVMPITKLESGAFIYDPDGSVKKAAEEANAEKAKKEATPAESQPAA